jgi:hypothetical protein
MGQKAFIFLPWSFFSSNFFDHITKDASFLHFKLGVIVSLGTSGLPPFQNTPHIITVDLLQAIDFLHTNMANLP